ncbi:MAG: phosphotransferase [Propionibacteriaceae bacterium]|jgi:CTP:phosphocholine cytidylyltransferase-like protein|nr:phosphotransferase [Propionibacteriaceae bacterium]
MTITLTRAEFEVLNTLRLTSHATQRLIAETTELSLGTVNSTVKLLERHGFLEKMVPTATGLSALEPYRVGNAIIMAAGTSSRFAPISYEHPKGLLTVRGEVLIEREIRQLQAAGITDITVVVGYMMEQFLYLEDAFGVKIVVNPEYATRNNTSTLKLVADRLANTYICSSDNYFTENVFEPYVWGAYYSAVYAEGPTDEFGLTCGAYDRITKVTPGRPDSWVMMGHAYFDKAFSAKWNEVLDGVYDRPETAPKLWESVYADHVGEFDMRIRRYEPGVIYEFDHLDDLRAFDPGFIVNIDSAILDNICTTLDVTRADLSDFVPIVEGLTNLSFRFTASGQRYVYRHPGVATYGLLDRAAEAEAEAIALELGLDETFIYLDPAVGWKISRFVDIVEPFDYHNPGHVDRALRLVRALHESGRAIDAKFNIYTGSEKWVDLLLAGPGLQGRTEFPDFDRLRNQAKRVYELAESDGVEKTLCHNDFYDPNLLITADKMYLIDWEYVGMSDYASDLGTFICCSDYTPDEAEGVFTTYFGHQPTPDELRHCLAYVSLAAHYWWVWALYKDACGEPVGEYTYLWYRYAKDYGERALKLYESES